jgi:hypothetical protein
MSFPPDIGREATEELDLAASPPPPRAEDGEAVERGRSGFAASAWLDADIGRSTPDDVAEPDLLVRDKAGQAHPIRSVPASRIAA